MRSSTSTLWATALVIGQGLCHTSPRAIPAPKQSTPVVPNDIQAFSIEFAFFPDYAGNKSHPNQFSKNLLENFKTITGMQPIVRVGGTSQYVWPLTHLTQTKALTSPQRPRLLLPQPRGERPAHLRKPKRRPARDDQLWPRVLRVLSYPGKHQVLPRSQHEPEPLNRGAPRCCRRGMHHDRSAAGALRAGQRVELCTW